MSRRRPTPTPFASERRPGAIRRAWRRFRRGVARALGLERPLEPPADWGWFEPALVPTGSRRTPPRAGAVALEPPTEPDPLVFPTETDAVGRDEDLAL